jgi:hypothetical protein
MEDCKTPEKSKVVPTGSKDDGASQKIHCEDCDGYTDCPRMRGINHCLGAAKWLEKKANSDELSREAGG